MNAHQLAKALHVDYKTVQHHIRILLDNNIIAAIRKGLYGAAYYVSPEMDKLWDDFGEIWERIGKK